MQHNGTGTIRLNRSAFGISTACMQVPIVHTVQMVPVQIDAWSEREANLASQSSQRPRLKIDLNLKIELEEKVMMEQV